MGAKIVTGAKIVMDIYASIYTCVKEARRGVQAPTRLPVVPALHCSESLRRKPRWDYSLV